MGRPRSSQTRSKSTSGDAPSAASFRRTRRASCLSLAASASAYNRPSTATLLIFWPTTQSATRRQQKVLGSYEQFERHSSASCCLLYTNAEESSLESSLGEAPR